jgi:hypothetical protein
MSHMGKLNRLEKQGLDRLALTVVENGDANVLVGNCGAGEEHGLNANLCQDRHLPFGLSWSTAAIWLLIFLSGAALRLRGIGRPLWLDEAWVANSVLTPSLKECFHYETWLQTTPPMYLMAIRLSHKLLGGFEIGFRVVPFTFSVLAILLALILGKRLFGPAFGLFLGAITAVSPVLIRQSLQLKQYSADLFCSFLLMLLIWDYSQNPTRRRFAWLSLVTLFCLPLAYATIIFLPLAACVILLCDGSSRTALRRTITFTVAASIVFLTLHVFFIKPNRSPELVAYWYTQEAFPQRGSGMIWFYITAFRRAFWMFYERAAIARSLGALAVCGVISLLYSAKTARSRVLLGLAGIPVFTLLVLNLLGLYPFYQENLDIFLFPCLAVMSIVGMVAIAELVTRIGGERILLRSAPVAFCIAAFLLALRADLLEPPKSSSEDPASAVRFLQNTVRAGDLVYVHASAEEQIKLYMRLFGVHGLPVVFGNTGWPCCTRHHQFETGPVKDEYVLADLQNHLGTTQPRRLFLVFADRASQWEWVGRNERQIILRHEEQMCQHVDTQRAAKIVVDDFRCNPPAVNQ